MTTDVLLENVGPIEHLAFALTEPGVTVLTGPNGVGKSWALNAVQAAARGKGKLPLRDGQKKGRVIVGGATITIGASTRHGGEFGVTNLEGRFDLAMLVDPGFDSPAAADRARIKSLVNMTNPDANATMFEQHEAFDEFRDVVGAAADTAGDLVEMASKIKEAYDKAALKLERDAEKELGTAAACSTTPEGVDMSAESRPDVLLAAYNSARDNRVRMETDRGRGLQQQTAMAQARAVLEAAGADQIAHNLEKLRIEQNAAEAAINLAAVAIAAEEKVIADAQSRMQKAANERNAATAQLATIRGSIALCEQQRLSVEKAQEAVQQSVTPFASLDDIEAARAAEQAAMAAQDTGTTIRHFNEQAKRAAIHRTTAKDLGAKAQRYRDAGKATDEVLSAAIRCSSVRVALDGTTPRLTADVAGRGSVLFHELSDGQRWKIAIDIGADVVGEGGLLVINQIGWEGLDARNRIEIHEYAKQLGVYILTAEATSDPNAKAEIIPTKIDVAPRQAETTAQSATTTTDSDEIPF